MKLASVTLVVMLLCGTPALAGNILGDAGTFEDPSYFHTPNDFAAGDVLGLWHASTGLWTVDDIWPSPAGNQNWNVSLDGANHYMDKTGQWTQEFGIWLPGPGDVAAGQEITLRFDYMRLAGNAISYRVRGSNDLPWDYGELWAGAGYNAYGQPTDAAGNPLFTNLATGSAGGTTTAWTTGVEINVTPAEGYDYYYVGFSTEGWGGSGTPWTSSQKGIDNVELFVFEPAATVPEPATVGLLALGGLALLLGRRWRARAR